MVKGIISWASLLIKLFIIFWIVNTAQKYKYPQPQEDTYGRVSEVYRR